MRKLRKVLAAAISAVLLCSAAAVPTLPAAATDTIESNYTWDTLKMGGAGFVSGIVTGQKEMYLRTDVGGAYRYDYDQKRWVQLFGFLNEDDRGLLSCKGIAIDPTDDMTAYFLCGCAYFSDAKTCIFKTTDGGKTFTSVDVTDQIQVHGNGDGRECIEPIAVDPDNPDTIYAGGDVTGGKSALIKSTDGGKTWNPVEGYDKLGLFSGELKYPSWTDHMVRGTEPAKLYNEQNGIGCVYIEGGKVYVGTSVTGEANIHVASVKDDKFEPIEALPNENYPLSITSDHNGNLFFTYIGGLAFAGGAGGAYKYNIKSGEVEKLSVSDNSIGMIEVDRKDPNKMFARTCGVWSDQWCGTEWVQDDPNTPENEGTIAWGDHFFRSSDGGKTWEDITPGAGEMDYSTGDGVKKFTSLPLDTNGYDWIYGKACHWGSGILIDPRDPEGDRLLLTSGNGVFACDNAWAEKDIQFYFQPDGVEECVSLDFFSTADGLDLSAIGDYDGFIHESATAIPEQYKPNMGSTSAITVCPQNTDVWARTAEGDGNNTGSAFYTLDRGKTWTAFPPACRGGKLSITELSKGKYRVINTSTGGQVSYSDDWGETWNKSEGVKASKAVREVTEADVNTQVDLLRQRNARLVSVDDRAAQMGDEVNIDFEGFFGDVAFEGGKGEQFPLKLGSGQFIPGFEDQIVGKNVGDEFDVVVTFPENYQMEDYAGKEATFKCKLNGITIEELPEADDEFIQDSTEFDTLEAFKEDAKKNLETSAQREAETAFDNAIMDALIKMVDVPIPNVMYEHRLDSIVANFENMLQQQGMSLDLYLQYTGMDINDFRETNRDRAENEVKLRLALEKIADLENIQISDEEINDSLKDIAEANKMNVEEVKRRLPMGEYIMDMRVTKAIELVKANAEIVDEAPAEEKAD